MTVEDPAEGVGSGAATLNALLSVGEHLSAKNGFSVLNSDVFQVTFLDVFLPLHVSTKGCEYIYGQLYSFSAITIAHPVDGSFKQSVNQKIFDHSVVTLLHPS